MTFARMPIGQFATAVSRGLRSLGRADIEATALQDTKRVPLRREEVEQLFELGAVAPEPRINKLVESELRERDSMSMIRSALYASD